MDSGSTQVLDAVNWILSGQAHADILEALARAGAGNPQAILEAAYDYISYHTKAASPDRIAWHLEARRELYRKAIAVHDLQTARQVLKDLARLEGLYTQLREAGERTAPQQTDDLADGIDLLALPATERLI